MYKSIEIIKIILMIFSCILFYKLLRIPKDTDIKTFTNNTIEKGLKKVPRGYFNYERLEKYLKKMGKDETPIKFMTMKIGLGILFMIAGIMEGNILVALALLVVGFFIPDYMVKHGNDNDNELILIDLKRVYDTLRIQTKAGVHINDSLSECYLVAKNERLKEGLLTLSSTLTSNKDFEKAIQEFNDKFNSIYIDTFCIILKQSLESGKTVQILEDLSEQIIDIEEAMYIREEDRAEKKVDKILFLVYVGVIVIAVYGLYIELVKNLANF